MVIFLIADYIFTCRALGIQFNDSIHIALVPHVQRAFFGSLFRSSEGIEGVQPEDEYRAYSGVLRHIL